MKTNVLYTTLLFIFGLIAFSGCSPLIKVYSEEEPGVKLSKYYTYDWDKTDNFVEAESIEYPLSDRASDKIRSATDAQMKRYGFQRFDFAPDLLLHYHVTIKNKVYLQSEEPSMNVVYPESARSGNYSRAKPVHFQEGTLIIDFMDTQTGRQVWRGVAVGIVENQNPEEWDAAIEHTIQRIFAKLDMKPILAPKTEDLAR